MQLTDAEIREILKREKRIKRRKQQRRRRITALIILILLIVLIVVIKVHSGKDGGSSEEKPVGIIFIDPGHGGDDPGADNGARYEKDDVLKLGQAIRTYLEGEGFEVHMSRTDDTALDDAKRVSLANDSKAQLMISLHRNDSEGTGEGVEAYIPKENSPESRLLAESIVKALVDNGFTEREVRSGTLNDPGQDYPVLSGLNMPACLVEVGFISNLEDNDLFDKNLNKNARSISDAIETVFISIYPPQTEETDEAKG